MDNQLERPEEEREGIIQPSAVERRYALRHESTSALRSLRAILAQAVSERQAYLDEAQAVLQHYLPGTFFVVFLKSVIVNYNIPCVLPKFFVPRSHVWAAFHDATFCCHDPMFV